MNPTSNRYIFGIDPGTNTGVAVYELSDTLEIISINTYTISLNKHIEDDNINSLDKDVERYLMLGTLIEELLIKYNPIAIAYESSFINMKFMKAGMSVMGYISVIMFVIKKFKRNILLCRLAPKSVKKFMGNAKADKNNMKALVPTEVLKYIDIEKETEHSIDAVAIGYNLLDILKTTPHLLR